MRRGAWITAPTTISYCCSRHDWGPLIPDDTSTATQRHDMVDVCFRRGDHVEFGIWPDVGFGT